MLDTLEYLTVDGPDRSRDVIVYALSTCGFCKRAMAFLEGRGFRYRYLYMDKIPFETKAEALEKWLRARGVTAIERHDAPDPRAEGGVRPNIVATIPGADDSKRLWIMAHLDVVPEGEGVRHVGPARLEHLAEPVEDLAAVVGGAPRPAGSCAGPQSRR